MSGKLYVGNVSWNTSEAALAEHFRQHGNVVEAKIITDRETGRSRGFAFVTMATPEEARVAQEQLDSRELDGRQLRVNEAHEKEGGRSDAPRRDYGGGGDSGMRRGGDDRGGRGGRDGRRGRDY